MNPKLEVSNEELEQLSQREGRRILIDPFLEEAFDTDKIVRTGQYSRRAGGYISGFCSAGGSPLVCYGIVIRADFSFALTREVVLTPFTLTHLYPERDQNGPLTVEPHVCSAYDLGGDLLKIGDPFIPDVVIGFSRSVEDILYPIKMRVMDNGQAVVHRSNVKKLFPSLKAAKAFGL